MANHSYNVTMPARFRPKDAKPILGIVVGYPLNIACEDFLGRRLRLGYLSHRWPAHAASHYAATDYVS